MEDVNTTQAEETPGMEEFTEDQAAEFEAALNEDVPGEEEQGEAEQEETGEEAENGEKEESEEEKNGEIIEVDGRKYTKEDISGLLGSITRLQAQVNAPRPESEFIARMAVQSGMDTAEFMQKADGMMRDAAISARTAQLIDSGYDEAMARHVAELEIDKEASENLGRAQQKSAETAQTSTQERVKRETEEFARVYPDVAEIPQEVFEDIKKTGIPLLAAYERYLSRQTAAELAAVKEQLAAQAQNEKNKKNTPGSVKGRGVEKEDPFLAALMK